MNKKVDHNSLLQSILKDTKDLVFVKDLEGRYVVANQATADFLGVTVEAILERDDTQLFTPEIARSIMEVDRQVIAEARSLSYEEEIRNGEKACSLLTSKYPWRDEIGNILGVIGISRDITALKKSQQKVQEQEQLLRLALKSANAGSWDWKIDTGELVWSPENYELYGLDPKQDKLEYQDWSNKVHPEDLERVNREVQQVLSGQLSEFNSEFRIIHPQRGIRWIWGLGNVTLDDDNRPIRLSGLNLDISDRQNAEAIIRQRERELKLITEVIPQQIWTALPNGQIDYVNQRWQDYIGLTLEQIQERSWDSIVHPEDLTKVNQNWIKAIKSEGNYNVKARLLGKNGVYCWFLCRARPLYNSEGVISKWYGTNTSITRIVELESKLKQQAEDLIRANQLKDEFLAIISHELRPP